MKPFSFIKETLTDALRLAHSPREGLKSLYSVSLYRNSIYLMLNSATLALTGFFFWAVAAKLYPTRLLGLGDSKAHIGSNTLEVKNAGENRAERS